MAGNGGILLYDSAGTPLVLGTGGALKTTLLSSGGSPIQAHTPGDAIVTSSATVDVNSFNYQFNGVSQDRQRVPAIFKDVNVAVVAGTAQTIWTPAAGKKFRLMGWSLSLSVAGTVIFVYGAAPTTLFRIGAMPAGDSQITPPGFGNGVMPGAANDVLKVDVSANGTVLGFVFGTEE